MLSTRQFVAALAALTLSTGLGGVMPMLRPAGPDADTGKAVERIADELANIRGSLVTTQIEMTKALAIAMQELTDHSRRLDRLEDNRKR
jgi:hypothetical protein